MICGLGPQGYELALEALASLIEAERGDRRMKVGPRAPLVPDADVIRALAGLLSETGLSEIEYAVGDHRIRVARESAGKAVLVNGHVQRRERKRKRASAPAAEAGRTGRCPPATGVGTALDDPGLMSAPLVGVAYLAPQPGRGAVRPDRGSDQKGQTLLIIEAMKVMNQIRAPRAGRLARIWSRMPSRWNTARR